ncbi:3-hydroxyacyl-CoA dehydrogenase family protein [Mesoterricola silvestris]|nr:3-hydroxyacyl-CoA dehydrogenase family protein [Mesoterricola silvestris]
MQNVAVVGAAGKMGSGISLLLALELAYRSLEDPKATFVLSLIDMNDSGLQGLLRYVRDQARKDGERQVNRLRALYRDRADLVENAEMVEAFVAEVMLHLRTGRTLALAKDALLVFEAAFEKEEIKFQIYDELAALCPPGTWFLTNTSSIPLHVLTHRCGIQGRMIGFHFYNPPAVQKLVELIPPEDCDPALEAGAEELALVLRKKTVPARDIAGFIGNGHFMRDGLRCIREMERLAPEHGFARAVHMVEKVSRDWLLRPMGMFQLIDYVGIDVFQLILRVMEKYLQEGLHSPLVDTLLEQGVRGGQTSSGAQKDGFLRYEKGRPVGILDPATRDYVPVDAAFAADVEARLGPLPDPSLSWKALSRDPGRERKLRAHFAALKGLDSQGAAMARRHAADSRDIALDLVRQGVAARAEDVNAVLTLGFFHLYGPVNDFLD